MKTATLHQSLQAKLGAYTGEHLTAAIRYQDRYGNLVEKPLLDATLDEVRHGSENVAGTLRINAGAGAARWLLEHVVPTFLQRHPHVALDIVSEGRLVDIIAEGFDAGVRLGNPAGVLPYSVLVSADGRVLKTRIGPFADLAEIRDWAAPPL